MLCHYVPCFFHYSILFNHFNHPLHNVPPQPQLIFDNLLRLSIGGDKLIPNIVIFRHDIIQRSESVDLSD